MRNSLKAVHGWLGRRIECPRRKCTRIKGPGYSAPGDSAPRIKRIRKKCPEKNNSAIVSCLCFIHITCMQHDSYKLKLWKIPLKIVQHNHAISRDIFTVFIVNDVIMCHVFILDQWKVQGFSSGIAPRPPPLPTSLSLAAWTWLVSS